MPYIYTDVDIDIDDFLDSCSPREKQELVKILKEELFWNDTEPENLSLMELEWNETLNKLANARLNLSIEDEEIIKKIANKYY